MNRPTPMKIGDITDTSSIPFLSTPCEHTDDGSYKNKDKANGEQQQKITWYETTDVQNTCDVDIRSPKHRSEQIQTDRDHALSEQRKHKKTKT